MNLSNREQQKNMGKDLSGGEAQIESKSCQNLPNEKKIRQHFDFLPSSPKYDKINFIFFHIN